MKLVKKTAQYSIYQRGDARYAVKDARKQPINGEEKARILVVEDLVKLTLPAKPAVEEAPAVEVAAALDAPDAADAPVTDGAEEEPK